jgi:hypothetical protein
MSDLNIRYSNCFDFINNTKQYLEANPSDWRNIYTMEDLIHAECDLMEMELEASYDAEEYDSLMNGNTFRTAKKANRRKANIRHHKADRYHGKGLEPYLYKEDGVIKESIEQVWHRCHMPVLDRVRNKSALKAEAREQDYLSSIMDQKVDTTEIVEEENYDDFLWYLIDELPEQKYIILHSWYNGGAWENSEGYSDRFLGVKTKDEIIKELMERALHNDTEIQVNETEKEGLKGLYFNWDFGCDEWGDWKGFENFVLIPISNLD